MYSGTSLLPLLFDVLLRFGIGRIALISDIVQAFLNIEIDPKHQDLARFLWMILNDNGEMKIVVYKFLRVLFGLTPSPFLLNGTVKEHMSQFEEHCDGVDIIKKLLRDLYVDDSVTSFHHVHVAEKCFEVTDSKMKSGGFQLRKWMSNSEEVFKFINEKEKAGIDPNGDGTASNIQKVLGLSWDVKSDEFVFSFENIVTTFNQMKKTKRNLLKLSSMFFDPMGKICPIVLLLKVLFKSLCQDKHGWDEIIPIQVSEKWTTYIRNLTYSTIRVKRHVQIEANVHQRIELHGFADASNQAYCSVVYVRVIDTKSNNVNVTLWCGKSRVAPMKKLTIPRLELLGCLLLAKLIRAVLTAVQDEIEIKQIYCWTDSKIAYYWIVQTEKQWKQWVETRVNKIRNLLPVNCWNHVPGDKNPADLGTREILPALIENNASIQALSR